MLILEENQILMFKLKCLNFLKTACGRINAK